MDISHTTSDKATILAFYLPQFHPFKENDEWWGEGYTEWINVARARPLFAGHEQPKLPGELGFYDLRLLETRESQARLAHEYGIDGFCYYYYRLNAETHLMERPLQEVLASHTPDFPFMLCWANHDWEAKDWNSKDLYTSRMLVLQQYGDDKDIIHYFHEILPYFKDSRYICREGKPLFAIYKPLDVPDVRHFMEVWNRLATEEGFAGIDFMGYTSEPKEETDSIMKAGFPSVISCRMKAMLHEQRSQFRRYASGLMRLLLHRPFVVTYKDLLPDLVDEDAEKEDIMPVIMPNWDPSPRRGRNSHIWIDTTPELFYKHVNMVLDRIKNKHNKIVFIKSWNEWGEGNYLEPDRKWKRGFLEALRAARNEKKL